MQISKDIKVNFYFVLLAHVTALAQSLMRQDILCPRYSLILHGFKYVENDAKSAKEKRMKTLDYIFLLNFIWFRNQSENIFEKARPRIIFKKYPV